MSDMNQLEQDLIFLWENFRVEPQYLQMELRHLRRLAAERGDAKDYVMAFLAETADLSGTAIAVLTPGHISLLTDDDGNPLEFR